MDRTILQQAFDIEDWSRAHRRYLHRHPEVSLAEKNTSLYCQNVLKELGYVITPCWGYGFTADFIVNPTYPTIAFRADMDALAMTEHNDHDFISETSGAAHMCGHDIHMTIALGTAYLLKQRKQELKTNIRFVFQPSEESPPGGALGMIENGCLDGVDEIYGLHNDPGTTVGHIKTRPGPLMAGGDLFSLTIQGRGGHGARPQDTLDPIIAGTQLINQWQSIISRQMNPNYSTVLSVTQFQAGQAFNVIPDQAFISGTVRTFNETAQNLIINQMQKYLEALKIQGYDYDFNYQKGYKPVINHASGVTKIAQAAATQLDENQINTDTEPQGWGEDFCYYLHHCPGAFYFLGSGNEAKGINQPLHSSQFKADEQCLSYGAAVMTAIALKTQSS